MRTVFCPSAFVNVAFAVSPFITIDGLSLAARSTIDGTFPSIRIRSCVSGVMSPGVGLFASRRIICFPSAVLTATSSLKIANSHLLVT